MAAALTITIMPHPTSATHKLATVRTRTRVYAVTYAEPYPTEAEIQQLWAEDRKAFRPYDETCGRYVR